MTRPAAISLSHSLTLCVWGGLAEAREGCVCFRDMTRGFVGKAGARRVGVMVDDTLDELCQDERLKLCPHLHRVFFSFRDFE